MNNKFQSPAVLKELKHRLEKQGAVIPAGLGQKQSRSTAIFRIIFLLIPVGISFGILQLSWRHQYWRDSDDNQNVINEDLAILQVGAKAHEVLIIMSLSDVVLHYVRRMMISSKGMPFGLLTSAYQVTLGAQPVSRGFLFSMWSAIGVKKAIQWRLIGLGLFLLLVTLLGLAAGPASAIALIPRLNWWSHRDLFAFYTSGNDYGYRRGSPFELYIPKQLFPAVVDASSLPGPFCLNAGSEANSSCPSSTYDHLSATLNFTAQSQNITIDIPGNLARPMFSELQNFGRADAWTISHVVTNYLSLGTPSQTYNQEPNPKTIEARLGRLGTVMTPVVYTYCDLAPATVTNRSLANLTQYLNQVHGSFDTVDVPPPFELRQIWNESVLARSNTTMVEFAPLFENTGTTGLGAFIYTPADALSKVANVSICTITAHWDPNEVWMISTSGQTLMTNFTWSDYAGMYSLGSSLSSWTFMTLHTICRR